MTIFAPPEVVVAGGGIAALEFVLALRELAGERARITLITPEPDFVLRPLLAAAPLGAAAGWRRPLTEIAAETGFRLEPSTVELAEPDRRRVVLRSGDAVSYDVLVLAPGVDTIDAFEGAVHIGGPDGARGLEALQAEIRAGAVRSVAFVAPSATGWVLPLYEAALIVANGGDSVAVSLVTPEDRPLGLFGPRASAAVEQALLAAGVELVTGRHASVADLVADRIVSLPLVRGRRIVGVPTTGPYGLIPVDPHGRVTGLSGVYAIGDATDFPVKQGGIACQQADAAAEHIAAGLGAAVIPVPFRAELRATVLTGAGDPILLNGGQGPEKLPGRRLGAYLGGTVDA